jgi:hypothetical protein
MLQMNFSRCGVREAPLLRIGETGEDRLYLKIAFIQGRCSA